jgi:hypothetical protein
MYGFIVTGAGMLDKILPLLGQVGCECTLVHTFHSHNLSFCFLHKLLLMHVLLIDMVNVVI